MMDVDRPLNKRSRDELDLDTYDDHSAKRARLSTDSFPNTFAASGASSPPASDINSAASTPLPMDEDTEAFFAPAPQSSFQQSFSPPQHRPTIISALNQARRTEDLRITCPWLFA